MRIRALGELEVRGPDGTRVDLGGPMLRALLLRLAVDTGRVVTTDRLVADLWPHTAPADPTAALQSLVARLRRALGRDAIGSHPTGYRLDLPPEQVDLHAFARAVAEGRPREALALWRGAPLADVADTGFAQATLARLEELRLSAVEARLDLDLAAGATPELVAEIEELATATPLREGLHARLMRALCARGRHADALAAHERARALLADQLGADPGPELREAHRQALRAPTRRPGLPARLTSFVGREHELDELTRALAEARLVTVTGPGGAGKTRLALEAADRTPAPDGVWLVDLAPVPADDGLLPAVRAALGTTDRPADFLAGRTALLLLDNCEHLLDGVAGLAADLLARCPRLRVLATSREPLGVTGEVLRPLDPLPGAQAVALFTDRARAVRPGFTPDETTTAICRALDGLPLAVELAAARLRSLTPAQLTHRLGDRLGLLDRGVRGAPARHRTLRAVLDWSHDLLDPAERTLLARLSVFAGGATLRAVEDVTGGTLDQVASLVDKSLVVATDERYRLLETVREYAATHLEDADRVRARHTAHYTALAEHAEPRLRGPEQAVWVDRLATEQANLDQAMSDRATSPRLFTARLWYWLVRTELAEARRWATAVLAADPFPDPTADLAHDLATALLAPTPDLLDRLAAREEPAALAVAVLADHTNRARLTAVADRLTASTDPWRRAAGHLLRGYATAEIATGGAAPAEEHYTAAAQGFRDTGDHLLLACSLMFRSVLQADRGATAEAMESLSEAMRHISTVPAVMLVQAARLHARAGDLDHARRELERAERDAVHDDDPLALARLHNGLAEIARLSGDTATALRWHHKAMAVDPALATTQFLAGMHGNYARTLTELGDLDLAGHHHERAVELARRSQDGPAHAAVLEGQAEWHVARGDRAAALDLLDQARRLRGTDNPGLRARVTGTSGPGTG
ncbi:BTAD domain-containing putative transcriptional regulator [Saccharothrix syringae]|uniref:AfsR/SARP family transcriptional regulator n=1 Tax=Saccharothrix syringae TaxID=103733 RepID=A0A5Q0H3B9_SACSY|nr:BTAD domain-containing putative transcriptional regulator [Saccharothrix syringae]QFZ20212.1 AfsR/SARP family transcriptional regulator [Saccharothrix syringae]